MELSYRGIKVELPIEEAIQIEYFCLKESLNEHVRLSLKILMDEMKIAEAVEALGENSCIIVTQMHRQNKREQAIFKGKPLKVSMCEEAGHYYLLLECVSYAYDWDLEKKSQSFCDLDLTYKNVIEKVLKPYPKKDFQDQITNNAKIPDFLLQYEETDWTFLRRLATHFETFLLEDPTETFGRIYFGLPKLQYGMKLEQDEFIIQKDLEKYYFFNALEAYYPQETITWHIQTPKRLYLGEEILLNKVKTQVTSVTLETIQDELIFSYVLSRLKGVRVPYQMHPDIYGMSIPAVVKERKGNCVRVHFDIDPVYEARPNLKYFTYAIESSSFYCMPEEGSKVHIYFPSHDEREAIAVHAIRTATGASKYNSRAQNPDNKSFSNTTGSEMKMTPSDISFAADEGKKICITLDQSGNINLVGKNISMQTQKSMNIGEREAPPGSDVPPVKPKSIHITAKENLALVREDGSEQGIFLTEEQNVMATFMKKDGSVKNPPAQSPESFLPDPAEDEALRADCNANAYEQLEAKKQAAVDSFRKGVCTILKTVAITALAVGLTVATGGAGAALAGPLMMTVYATGAAQTVMAISDTAEAVQDYKKVQSGDLRQSYNFMRDTVFQGNEKAYRLVQGGVEIVFGIVSSIAIGGGFSKLGELGKLGKVGKVAQLCSKSKKAQVLSHMGVNGITSAIDSYIQTGKVDPGSLAFNVTLGAITGHFGSKATQGIIGKLSAKGGKYVDDVLNSTLGRKATNMVVGTTVDTAMDGAVSWLTGQPYDIKQSLANNLTANFLAECFGEPIDAVTGGFFIDAVDFKMPDLNEEFGLKRHYSSADLAVGMLGKGWHLNYDSQLFKDEARVYATLVTGHTVSFVKIDGTWQNEAGENGRFSLSYDTLHSEWHILDYKTHNTYVYNATGRMIYSIDKNNQKTIFEYNNQRLQKITTSLGYTLRFTFDEDKLIQVTDDLGRTLQYRYEGDLLTHVVHLDQGISTYTYTKEGYIESAIDKNGVTYLTNTYDAEGRTIFQELANGYTYEATYDTKNYVTTVNYNKGEKIERFYYDENLLIHKIEYMDGTATYYDYDAYKNRCYEKNRLGAVSQKIYSPYNELLEEVLPNGLHTVYSYDEDHRLIKRVDNGGRESLYNYDFKHNLIEEKHKIATGKWQSKHYTYDYMGRMLTEEDSLKGMIEYVYDEGQSEPSRVKNAMGEITYYEYDKLGRRMSIENDYGTVEFGYNNLNYVTRIKDGEGNITQKLYDQMGKLVAFYSPKAWASKEKGYTYKYDFLDHLVEVIDPLDQHYKQETDVEGNLIKQIHPNTYDSSTETGLTTTFEYNIDNKCIKKHYLDGGIERFFYDAEGNLMKHVLPEAYDAQVDDGRGYTYSYNEMNQLVTVINPEGVQEASYTYNLNGDLLESRDAKGYTTYYRYDLLGNLIEKREPVKEEYNKVLYKLTCFEYDLNGNKITEKHGLDFVVEEGYPRSYHSIYLSYDKNNHLIKVKDDYGAMLRYEYNCLGQRSYEERKINEEVSQCIHYIYNKAGWLVQKKEALDSRMLGEKSTRTLWAVTKYNYDANGNLTAILTPKGYQIERSYDACDRLVSEHVVDKENGIDRTTYYTYDAANNVIKVEEQSEGVAPNKRAYDYDLKDRLTHIKENESVVQRYFYNKNDQLIKEVDARNYQVQLDNGAGTTYSYDARGNRVQTVNALGQIVEANEYDPSNNLLVQKDALGHPITYDYTIQNQVLSVSTARTAEQGKKLQTYSYNANGQITGIIDGNHNETFYQVDGWGRITEVTAADGGVEKYTYDHAGNITTTTDANGGTITYHYNSFGKVSEIIDQEGLSEKFYYDEEGRLTLHIDRNGNRVENTYNIDGNLVSQVAYADKGNNRSSIANNQGENVSINIEETPSTVRKSYSYNTKGQLLTAKADGFVYNYSYTPEGYLASKSTCGRTLIAYTYYKDGQIASIKDITGKSTYYSYDILGRINELTDDEGKVVAKYTYLPNNLIESIIYGNGIKTVYSYDSDQNISHLLTLTTEGEKLQDFAYQYDLNGNRLSKVGLNQETHFAYDSMNRLIKTQYPNREESFTYDLVGNRLSQTLNGEISTFIYNTKNQLVELHKDLGITNFTYDVGGNILKESSPQGTSTFSYNALNQQTKVTTYQGNTLINRYDAEGLRAEIEENQKLTKFIFHKDEILVETDQEDQAISRLIRGYDVVAGDIADVEGSTGSNEQGRYYYQLDEQFSTSFITNDIGKVKNRYTYDAFGNTLESQEGIHNRIKYTGQQYDPVTQQYYLRARFYNPILGRFMQEDIYRGDGLNLYAYCRDNPIMYYDPSGYVKQSELAQLVKNMTPEQIRQELQNQYEQFKINKLSSLATSEEDLISFTYGKKNKVTNELTIASYGATPKPVGDDMTPHHMPAADSIQNDGIGYKEGICTNTKTSTHYLTFTYGMGDSEARAYDYALYNALSYEERLDFDIENLRWAYGTERVNVDMDVVNDALQKHRDEAMKVYNEAQNKKANTIDKTGKCTK